MILFAFSESWYILHLPFGIYPPIPLSRVDDNSEISSNCWRSFFIFWKSLSSSTAKRRWNRLVLIIRIWYRRAVYTTPWISYDEYQVPVLVWLLRGMQIHEFDESFLRMRTGRRKVAHFPQDSFAILTPIDVHQISRSLKSIGFFFVSSVFLSSFHESKSFCIETYLTYKLSCPIPGLTFTRDFGRDFGIFMRLFCIRYIFAYNDSTYRSRATLSSRCSFFLCSSFSRTLVSGSMYERYGL